MLDLIWLVPALPLVGFVTLLLFGKRIGEPAAGYLATGVVGASFVVTSGIFLALLAKPESGRVFTKVLWAWMPSLGVDVALQANPLSLAMALFVTGIAALIHLFAVSYMAGDPRYPRFFTYLNLFVFSMLMLVLADNFALMFLGWEGVGACSYLLISFWFEKDSASSAGKKAFITNRVGDFGLMLAMFLLFENFGTLQYNAVMEGVHEGSVSSTTVTWICLALFLGAVGKSAQIPLYVWLPDAMEGPTPVSALIHAATMVTAGVYLMVRVHPLLDAANPNVLELIAWVGVITALFAATIATSQDDIKKVLAYSTISQLGYMFLAVGVGANVAAIFHMITHAFFKALMFLGAGSVIHGMHHEQDMKRMGRLRKFMPITAYTFIIGWLAIAGVFPLAGFWSKDEILLGAYAHNKVLWLLGLVTALLTAYYMTRQVRLVFFGDELRASHDEHSHDAHRDAHGQGAHALHTPHESPWPMTLPLVVLAGGALGSGALNLPFSHHTERLGGWLESAKIPGTEVSAFVGEHALEAPKLLLALVASGVALAGIALGWVLWSRDPAANRRLEPALLKRAYGVDDLYSAILTKPGLLLANFSAFVVDRGIIDKAVNEFGDTVRWGAHKLRVLQSGYVRQYALAMVAGIVALLAWAIYQGGV